MVQGKTIYLRLAEENDAKFILSLRNDTKLNRHLSKTNSDIPSQEKWLCDYKKREYNKTEFYFIICRIDDSSPIGTVRLYDFIVEKNSFCWGSWILNDNKTRTSAIESAMLVYDFAFNEMNFDNCHFDVRKNNLSVIKFHNKFGVSKVGETELDFLFEYTKNDYIQFFNENNKFVGK